VRHAESRFADSTQDADTGFATARRIGGFGLMAAASLLLLGILAGPAQAVPKGVAGYVGMSSGSGSKGAQFSNPRDVAVNRTGAGPADQGDFYVVDDGNARVQRFDSTGDFISAWGANVVTASADEAQGITVDATGGTFTLTFAAQQPRRSRRTLMAMKLALRSATCRRSTTTSTAKGPRVVPGRCTSTVGWPARIFRS